jgi:serine/threonine protein kinase
MGTVYRAYDTKLQREVAVKVLHHGSSDELARFQRETKLLGRINHPNVVSYVESSQNYLIMEFLGGNFALPARIGGDLSHFCADFAGPALPPRAGLDPSGSQA